MYSSGINEEIVGKAIKKFDIPRHKLTILAKCYGTVPDEPGIFNWAFEAVMKKSKDYVNQSGEICVEAPSPQNKGADDLGLNRVITRRNL